jgi:hypothetical protein
MAIDTERLKNGKGFAGSRPHTTTNTPVEGGGDMALALTATVQGQANQLVMAAQAANLSIDHASTQMADYFTEVMSGRALLNATMAKVQANLEERGTVAINTEVPPITLELPETPCFTATRSRFLGLFGGEQQYSPENPFLAPAAEVSGDA